MNTRRTILDTLNAGRQRKAETSLEQLSRSLENLELQLERRERGNPAPSNPPRHAATEDRIAQREPAYGRSDPYARGDSVSSEMRRLRDELQQQMGAEFKREFDTLRHELRQWEGAPMGREVRQFGVDLERLVDSVDSLAGRSDDRALSLLRLELEQVKSDISALAREETVQSVGARWDDFDRRLAALQSNLGGAGHSDIDPAFAALNERLDQIGVSVQKLPESLSFGRLEDKIRNLANAIDHFSRLQERSEPAAFSAIESRLEEISRAIVATSMTPKASVAEAKHFERIEQRLNSLARQFEAVDRPNDEMIDLLNVLSQRVEDIAASSTLPDRALDRLNDQIAVLADRVSFIAAPAADNSLLQDVERRLAEVATRLDQAPSGSASDQAIAAMQERLDYLATTMEQGGRRVGDVDSGLLESLETQLGALSAYLEKGPLAAPGMAEITPRLDRLEASLADGRQQMVQAAREAAEQAVQSFGGSVAESTVVSGLTEDLKSLEDLTRRSDDRNAKTFEAIHDTLIKIVDRLSSIDTTVPAVPEAPRVFGKAETPSLDVEDYDAPALQVTETARPYRSAAEVAAAAATAALSEVEAANNAMPRAKSAATVAPEADEAFGSAGKRTSRDAPEISVDLPLDPAVANRPLEPGSRTLDLNAIMNQVREDREVAARGDAEAARSDFIAAARRAAQAAAAEADVLKRNADTAPQGRGKSKFLDMLKARRKPIMMATAAIVVALLGLQLGGSLIGESKEVADNQVQQEAPAAPVASVVTPEPSNTTPEEPVRVVEKEADAQGPVEISPEQKPAMAAAVPEELNLESSGSPDRDQTAAISPSPQEIEPTSADAPQAETSAVHEKIDVPSDAGPVELREAAANGDPKALFEIGSRYSDGRGVKVDMAAAATWYQKSADLGFAPAQYRIGNLYEKGMGVERDLKKAKTWYQMAADQGNASAMHNLAVLFATDAGQGADNDSAARWFQKAAALGVKDSQFNLGILSAKGAGMPQDLTESYKWFAVVAKAGDRDAAQKRDEIANSLRPEQLKQAREKAENWKPETLVTAANSVDMPESWRESPAQTAGIDMKKAIRNVQALLNKAGYDAGSADGMMGGKTKTAIAAFQKDNGMEPSGAIDEKMVKALLAKK